MKSQNKKLKAKRRKQKQSDTQEPTRRDVLGLAKAAAVAIPVLGAVGYFSVSSVQASLAEGDLSRVNEGLPTIVQIHDPQCSMCQTLQQQTRGALKQHDDDSFLYLVANIKTEAGLAFATRYGVSHVTLLLFDANAEMKEVVRGPLGSSDLQRILDAHLKTYKA